ncbi:MAG: hypothetical protein ACI87N_000206 [Flavobacteriales bacterium]|jgi:hypothetical protein
MKSLITLLLIIALSFPTFSQDKISQQEETGLMSVEALPAVVIKRIGKDFSVYIPDRHIDQRVQTLEKNFIAYDIGKDYQGAESYLLVMETDTGTLSATYNGKGKLIRVVEKYENIRVPKEVMYSIYKTYPGWTIVNDKYLYTQEDGDVIKKQYNVKIQKKNESRKLLVHANGDIVKVK